MVLIAFLRNDKKWNRIKNFLITLHNRIIGKKFYFRAQLSGDENMLCEAKNQNI